MLNKVIGKAGCGCHLTSQKKGGGAMSIYEALSLMIMFSGFTLSLISLIVKLTKDNSKGKK